MTGPKATSGEHHRRFRSSIPARPLDLLASKDLQCAQPMAMPDSPFEWDPPEAELLVNDVWEGFDVQGLEDGPVALDGQEYLSAQDVGKIVDLHPRVIQRAVNAGEIPAFKLRGRIRIKRTDLEAWIADNQVEPQTLPEYDG